jgi:hypothetical protein
MKVEERLAAADEGVRLDELFIEEYEAPLTLTIDIEEGAILQREDDDDYDDDRPTIETIRPAWVNDLVGAGKKRSKSRTIGLIAIASAVGLGILAWGLQARKPSSWFARLGFAS